MYQKKMKSREISFRYPSKIWAYSHSGQRGWRLSWRQSSVWELDEKIWDKMMTINLKTAFLGK